MSDQVGRFDGWASFRPDTEGLEYEETGTLSFGAARPMQATRRFMWRAQGDRIAVLFDDGRPFHDFAPCDKAQADHDCALDTYRGTYDFTTWPVWSCTWDVIGPRKAYSSTTQFIRAARDPE